jgi:hypothetical protein
MEEVLIIVAVVVVVAVILAIVLTTSARRKHDRTLRSRFGPEYDRVVEDTGSAKDARKTLDARAERRDQLDIRPLPHDLRDRYLQQWNDVQSRFVDNPAAATDEADLLVVQVMRDRGYPMDDFDTRADLVSVDHPDVVHEYRAAHDIAMRSRSGQASTEDLRAALLHYRTLFQALLDTRDSAAGR